MNYTPSEGYLIFHRIITFLDEWLFYGLLVYLFTNMHDEVLGVVACIGALAIAYSYKRLWCMEELRFGKRPTK